MYLRRYCLVLFSIAFNGLLMPARAQMALKAEIPPYLRQGDHIELKATISNTSANEFTGQAQLLLTDGSTNTSVDGWFMNTFPNQYFTVAAGKSEEVSFPVQVPFQFTSALTWKIIARTSGSNHQELTSQQQATIPVLSNKFFVTTSCPFQLTPPETKTITIQPLLQSENNEDLQHQSLTIEISSHPAWIALNAMTAIGVPQYPSADQLWNSYFAHAMAHYLANAYPQLRTLAANWERSDSSFLSAFLSRYPAIETNLCQSTPWVLQSDAQQKRAIALLFNSSGLEQFSYLQKADGAFSWFMGGPGNRYVTQYILCGIGRLMKLGGLTIMQKEQLGAIVNRAFFYLDHQLITDYQTAKSPATAGSLQPLQVQYLYALSFFPEHQIAAPLQKAVNYFSKLAKTYWYKQSDLLQSMIAQAFFRKGDQATAILILKALANRRSSYAEQDPNRSLADTYYKWYDAPVETQAMLLQAFHEIQQDSAVITRIKTTLLHLKKSKDWGASTATAEASYALLLEHDDLTSPVGTLQVTLGRSELSNADQPILLPGFMSKTFNATQIRPDMGHISITAPLMASNSAKTPPPFGAVYWQYFTNKAPSYATSVIPLSIHVQYFIISSGPPRAIPLTKNTTLHSGEKIKARITIKTTKELEYLHVQDLCPSGLQPAVQTNMYRQQKDLPYFQTSQSTGTSFFIDRLTPGTFTFEYDLTAAYPGTFTGGLTTIQCVNIPNITAHTISPPMTIE